MSLHKVYTLNYVVCKMSTDNRNKIRFCLDRGGGRGGGETSATGNRRRSPASPMRPFADQQNTTQIFVLIVKGGGG